MRVRHQVRRRGGRAGANLWCERAACLWPASGVWVCVGEGLLRYNSAMPRMFPSQPDADAPDSERKVFAALAKQLPASWMVFHSQRVSIPSTGHPPATAGELDFLVVDPQRGMLGLEVKGGILQREENGWLQNGRRIKSPGQQSQRVVHTLNDYLTARRMSVSFGWGVVFPDARCPSQMGSDLPAQLVVDADAMSWVDKAVDSVFRSSLGDGTPMSPGDVARLVTELAPCFSLVPSLAASIQDEETALVRLTVAQLEVLEVLADIPRLGICGGAGTGKSLVAMERARRLAAEGKRVLLLCFNRGLAAYLQARADGFTVSTFHSLCGELAKRAGIAATEIPTGPEAQQFWREDAPKTLMTALDRLPDERYDAVIVDEGQDFFEYWWIAVEKLLRHQNSGLLWVFYDPRQDIFGTGTALQALSLQTAQLQLNCRNTAQIARFAYGLIDAEPKLRAGTPEGSAVTVEKVATEPDMLDAVRRALHRFVSGGLRPSRIVVLSPLGTRKSAVWHARMFGNLSLVEFPELPGPNQVQFATLQRFKGLEADAVVLCEVDRTHQTCTPQHLYVAASRAKHVLVAIEKSYGAAPEAAELGS